MASGSTSLWPLGLGVTFAATGAARSAVTPPVGVEGIGTRPVGTVDVDAQGRTLGAR